MSYLINHWSFDPIAIIAAVLTAWHEIGLWRLARRSRPERTRQRRRRSLWFYAGLVVLLLAVQSPIDYWSDSYFFVHMMQHLLLAFAAPSLIVAGAPWQPLLGALPGRTGRSVTRGVLAGRWSKPLRAAGAFLLRPWVSVGLFNLAMIVWHLPGPYDLAESNSMIHIWVMHSSYFLAGVLFWLQYIPSPPFRREMPLVGRAFGLIITNIVMIGLAMGLSIFANHAVYGVYAHVPGVTLPAFADQQIGAAVLWVCGDFWAIPAMIGIVRQLIITEGSVESAVDAMLNRGAARGWARSSAYQRVSAAPEAGSRTGTSVPGPGGADAGAGAGSS